MTESTSTLGSEQIASFDCGGWTSTDGANKWFRPA